MNDAITQGWENSFEWVGQEVVELQQFSAVALIHAEALKKKTDLMRESIHFSCETWNMEERRITADAVREALDLSENNLEATEALIQKSTKELDLVSKRAMLDIRAVVKQAQEDFIELAEKFDKEIERFAEKSLVRKTQRLVKLRSVGNTHNTERERHSKKLRSVRVKQNQRVLQGCPFKP